MRSESEEIREITWEIATRFTKQENVMLMLFWQQAWDKKGGCDISEYIIDLCYNDDLWEAAKRGYIVNKALFMFHV